MTDLVDRALRLWVQPLPEGEAALTLFRGVYADPVVVNGETTPLQVLVDRARMMQGAFEGLTHDVHVRMEGPGRKAFAFHLSGRHAGPLVTPLGELAPTGLPLELMGMDIFEVDDERDLVTGVWAVADQLGLLVQAGAVTMVEPRRS